MKQNIIIVGDYSREDFLFVAKQLLGYFNFYFLEYADQGEIKSNYYSSYGKAIFWKDFSSSFDLVDKIKPKAVLFYFIETYNHVALNVTCKHLGIKTFHLEHGVRNYKIQELIFNSKKNETVAQPGNRFKKVSNLYSKIKTRFFFYNTLLKLPTQYSRFLKGYYKIRSKKDIFETFSLVKDQLRVADHYISFSPKIFEFHQKADHLDCGKKVSFTGVPSFDFLSNLKKVSDCNDILFIDNAFESQALFGWNDTYKLEFLKALSEFANSVNKPLWIKTHPYSNSEVYDICRNSYGIKVIDQQEEFNEALKKSSVIIGFYSTLLMALMALDHTVCFSLEMHPEKSNYELSSFLVETGATMKINNWEELKKCMDNIESIYHYQTRFKKKFISEWLYKFDGMASERLKNILLSEIS